MDFAVNRRAGGLCIYRIYDDFWCYGHDSAACVTTWNEVRKYADLVGISFDMKKTGSIWVGSELGVALRWVRLDGGSWSLILQKANWNPYRRVKKTIGLKVGVWVRECVEQGMGIVFNPPLPHANI